MGSSHSARKLTIVNEEDDINVIRISDAVAKRLSESASSHVTVEPVKEVKPTTHVAMEKAPLPTRTNVPHDAADMYYPHFTLSALEVQKQKEQELAEQEAYWQHRLINLQKTHEKLDQTLDKEYKKALTIFDDCRVIKVQNEVQPCNENRQKVLECYQQNPKETLRCSDLVQEFSNCVDQRRAQLMKCN